MKNPVTQPLSINDELLDKAIQQEILRRGFEADLDAKIEAIYERHYNQMSALIKDGRSYAQLEKRVRKEVMNSVNDSYLLVRDSLKRYIIAESETVIDDLDSTLNGAIEGAFKLRYAPKSKIVDLVANKPILDSRLLSEHFNSMAKGELFRLSNKVSSGLAKGLSTDEIASSLLSTLKITRIQAQTVARTAITQHGTTAAFLSYAENDDIISGYRYVATLDDRTTRICAYHDGRVYKFDDPKAPKPPLHWNCRSTTVPVVKAFTDLGGNRINEASDAVRARFDGQAPASLTYGDWLKTQPYDTIRSLLGSEQSANAFIDGSLSIDRFIAPNGHLLDVSQYIKASVKKNLPRSLPAATEGDTFSQEASVSSKSIPNFSDTTEWFDSEDSSIIQARILEHVSSKIGDEQGNGLFGLLNYRGSKISTKTANRRKFLGSAQDVYYDSINDRYLSPNRFNEYARTKAKYIEDIQNDKGLKDHTKAGLIQTLEKLEAIADGPAALMTTDALWRIAVIMDTGGTVENVEKLFYSFMDFKGTSKTGSIRNVSSLLETESRSELPTLLRLRDGITLNKRFGELNIEKLREARPQIEADVVAFRLPTGFGAKILEGIPEDDLFNLNPQTLESTMVELISSNITEQTVIAARIGRALAKEGAPASVEDVQRLGLQVFERLSTEYGKTRRIGVSKQKAYHEVFGPGEQASAKVQTFIEWTDESILQHQVNIEKLRVLDKLPISVELGDASLVAKAGAKYYTRNGKPTRIRINSSGYTGRIDEAGAQALNDMSDTSGFSIEPFAKFFLDSARFKLRGSADKPNAIQAYILKSRTNDLQALTTLEWMQSVGGAWKSTFSMQASTRIQAINNVSSFLGEFWRPVIGEVNEYSATPALLKSIRQRFAPLRNKSLYSNVSSRESYLLEKFKDTQYTHEDLVYTLGEIVEEIVNKKNNTQLLDQLWGVSGNLFTDPRRKAAAEFLHAHIGSDPKEAMAVARLAQEYYKMGDFTSKKGVPFANLKKLGDYKTRVRIELDTPESGNAAISLQSANEQAMRLTNAIPQGSIKRLRREVAERVLGKVNSITGLDLTLTELEKLSKNPVTTTAYGSQNAVRVNTLKTKLQEKVPEDIHVIDSKKVNVLIRQIEAGIKNGTIDKKEGRQVKKYILDEYNSLGIAEQRLLYPEAYDNPETKGIIEAYTDTGGYNAKKIVTGGQLRKASQLVNETLEELTPINAQYFKFQQEVARAVHAFTGNDYVDVTTLDGIVRRLSFTGEELVEFKLDENTLVKVLQTKKGVYDAAAANRGYGVLNNFTVDGYIAREVVRAAKASGRNVSVVYDGFHISGGDEAWLKETILGISKKIINGDPIGTNLKHLLNTGQLGEDQYRGLSSLWAKLRGDPKTLSKVLDDALKVHGLDGFFGVD